MNNHSPTLILDARPLIDGHSAALAVVSGHPYLATLVDMIRDTYIESRYFFQDQRWNYAPFVPAELLFDFVTGEKYFHEPGGALPHG